MADEEPPRAIEPARIEVHATPPGRDIDILWIFGIPGVVGVSWGDVSTCVNGIDVLNAVNSSCGDMHVRWRIDLEGKPLQCIDALRIMPNVCVAA